MQNAAYDPKYDQPSPKQVELILVHLENQNVIPLYQQRTQEMDPKISTHQYVSDEKSYIENAAYDAQHDEESSKRVELIDVHLENPSVVPLHQQGTQKMDREDSTHQDVDEGKFYMENIAYEAGAEKRKEPPEQLLPQKQKKLATPQERIEEIRNNVSDLMTKVEQFNGGYSDTQYRYLEETLIRNLIKLDDVDVDDDQQIRDSRKEVIKYAQKALALLKKKGSGIETEDEQPSTNKIHSKNTVSRPVSEVSKQETINEKHQSTKRSNVTGESKNRSYRNKDYGKNAPNIHKPITNNGNRNNSNIPERNSQVKSNSSYRTSHTKLSTTKTNAQDTARNPHLTEENRKKRRNEQLCSYCAVL